MVVSTGLKIHSLKAACFLSYVEIGLTQIQQYYEKQVMLRGGHI
jgi:hypothetical protein